MTLLLNRSIRRLGSALALAALSMAALAGDPPAASAPDAPAATAPAQPQVEKVVYVKLSTNFGDILLELDNEKTPISVANFVRYVDRGAYNGTIFHRTVKGFVIQGGGYLSNLTPQPTDPPIINESTNGLHNTRGTIAMARTDVVNSATNQFFINLVDNTSLDGAEGKPGYAVFGKVIGGMGVVDAISQVPVMYQQLTSSPNTPRQPVRIDTAVRISAADAGNAAKEADASAAKGKTELDKRLAPLTVEAQFKDAMDFLKGKGIDVSKGVKTPSGLWYVELEPGAGDVPAPSDTVTYHGTGWLTDGREIESTTEGGRPVKITVDQIGLKGIVEGIQTMRQGTRRYFVIPSDLGFGEKGNIKVLPESTVVYEIQLSSIEHVAPMPAPEKQFDAAMALLKSKGVDTDKGKKADSGLWYLDTVAGTGEQPTANDNVTVGYNAWLVTGVKFDSSYDRGQPASFFLNKAYPGLTEGITGMKVGGKRWLVMPSNLANGDEGRPPIIPGKSTLVFEIELVSISNENKGLIPQTPMPSDDQQFQSAMDFLKTQNIDTTKGVKTTSGLWYFDTVVGTGSQPTRTDVIKANYTGWRADGTKFQSTLDTGKPISLRLDQFVPGWIEGVGAMKVGGKRYLVIPSYLGYGDAGNGPDIPGKATLVFEVELLDVTKRSN